MSNVKLNTGFLSVFEQKLKKLIKKIDEELKKPKKDRNKNLLKTTLREAKDLKILVKECRKQNGVGCCPNCGHIIGED
jgi:ubiquitin